ncbi:MAG: metal ABC transporter ATP-binding protein [Marinifilaceae bacterium]|jgi:zinc transport system ATP-binding protein|nr:metal ABC transporter ATP-binding protein [Marinifilaceae bacterium]
MEELIELRNITAGYDNNIILDSVNMKIHDNDFIGVIGPNGGGKTTLIKVILGIIKPMKGEIIFKNNKTKNLIGYLPQYNIFDKAFPISILEVVMSGLMSNKKLYQRYTAKDKALAMNLLNIVGLENYSNYKISEISGGQMQRALLCRAIISNPKILILDEPVTYVDNTFEKEMYGLLKEWNKDMSIIMVSHDIGIISSHVKTIACVNRSVYVHKSNIIDNETLERYNCPIDIITHGRVPHRVLKNH